MTAEEPSRPYFEELGETVSMVRSEAHYQLPAYIGGMVKEAAARKGMDIKQFVTLACYELALDVMKLPSSEPVSAVPSVEDVVESYLTNTELIGPCGEPWPCAYANTDDDFIQGMAFCGSCGVRVEIN